MYTDHPTFVGCCPQKPPKQGTVIKFNINLYQSGQWPGAPVGVHRGTLGLLTLLGLGFLDRLCPLRSFQPPFYRLHGLQR